MITPLYAEAVNERGLCIAALNFPDNAYYSPKEDPVLQNVSPFELIPWLCAKCASVTDAKQLLSATHLVDIPFNDSLPLAPLHWHIADQQHSIVLESTINGMEIYDNPVGVLTKQPRIPFSDHKSLPIHEPDYDMSTKLFQQYKKPRPIRTRLRQLRSAG